jgi:SAM-dependent methyltransferase
LFFLRHIFRSVATISNQPRLRKENHRRKTINMNAPISTNKFVPKQALTPSPQLYDQLVGDSMGRLAKATLSESPSLQAGSIVHDNGCGTGAATSAIVDLISASKADISIQGTDINEKALDVYKSNMVKFNWPAEAAVMDSQKLSFPDDFFSHVIGNAFLFVLPNDGIDAVKETYRTLKPGGTAVFNSWFYVPNMEPLQIASRSTRPQGTPQPRDGMAKWSPPGFLQSVLEKGGFAQENITMTKAKVTCGTPELTHFATMLWSFIGGTSEIGWIPADEENWDQAIEIVKKELAKTEGFKHLDGGKAQLEFIANIGIATK